MRKSFLANSGFSGKSSRKDDCERARRLRVLNRRRRVHGVEVAEGVEVLVEGGELVGVEQGEGRFAFFEAITHNKIKKNQRAEQVQEQGEKIPRGREG